VLALQFSRDVAQVKAVPTASGMHLIVAMRGRSSKPGRAVIRELRTERRPCAHSRRRLPGRRHPVRPEPGSGRTGPRHDQQGRGLHRSAWQDEPLDHPRPRQRRLRLERVRAQSTRRVSDRHGIRRPDVYHLLYHRGNCDRGIYLLPTRPLRIGKLTWINGIYRIKSKS